MKNASEIPWLYVDPSFQAGLKKAAQNAKKKLKACQNGVAKMVCILFLKMVCF